MKKILVLLSLLVIASCSTYSKNDCENFNWYDVGYRSALRGERPSEKIFHYQRACTEEHNVALNTTDFQEGFKKGLQVFCSTEGGAFLGKSGKTYKGTCPQETEEAFLKSYDRGRVDFLAQRVSALESDISDLENELSSRESKIRTLESEISTLQMKSCP